MPDALRDSLGEDLPAPLKAWLDAGDPPIFLGFGSMPVLEPQPLLDDIISVTAALGRRAIVSENCVSPEAAGTLPDHLRVVGAVDHDRLFSQCSGVVHHGGIGIRRLRVGAHVPFRKLDRDALEWGLRRLLDPEVDARARALGAAIQVEGDGLPAATRLLEDWLVAAEPTPVQMPTRRRPATALRDKTLIRG